MKKALLFISALALSGAAFAQTDSKNAVVNVENSYTPVVIEVGKKNFTPSTERYANAQPAKPVFSKEGIAYTGFTSERDVEDMLPGKEKPFPGYARLGYGITNDIDAKAAYRLGVGKNGVLRSYAAFDGFRTNVGGLFDEWNSRRFKTIAGVGYSHRFNALSLDIDGCFSNDVFNYQSTGEAAAPVTDKQNGRKYEIAINGASNLTGAFSYNFSADFGYLARSYSTGTKKGIAEGRVGVGGGIGYEILHNCVDRFGIDLHLDEFTYNRGLREDFKGYNNHLSIDANPYVGLKFGKWMLRVGANMNFVTHGTMVFAIAPNITATSNLTENITVYGSLTGDRESNSLAKLSALTPYWGITGNSSRLVPTYRIADLNIGSRMSFKQLSFDINAGYAFTKDDLLEVAEPQTAGTFSLVHSNFRQADTHHLYVGARLGYDIRSWVKMSADARYDFWSCSDRSLLVMKPEVLANINAEFRIIEHLTLQLGYSYALYTKSEARGRISDKHDLHARVNYQITKRFGAYIQGNNLINDRYYEFAGYETRGIRGSLGATVNF